MFIRYFSATRANPTHPKRNEDAIGFNREFHWAGVFDGVGGSARGGDASRMALSVVNEKLSSLSKNRDQCCEEIAETLQRASLTINRNVPLGETTAVVAKVVRSPHQTVLAVGSVGDSRGYLFRNGYLFQLTADDRAIPPGAREAVDSAEKPGDLSDFDYQAFYTRNRITQALGGRTLPDVHTYSVLLLDGDRILLVTDGVSDNLTKNEIAQSLSKTGNSATALVERAYRRSLTRHFRAKKDDVSAVVLVIEKR